MKLSEMNTSDLQATVKYLIKEIEKCQNILATYAVPDSNMHANQAITEILGVLDDRNLIYFIKSLKIKEENGTSKNNSSNG